MISAEDRSAANVWALKHRVKFLVSGKTCEKLQKAFLAGVARGRIRVVAAASEHDGLKELEEIWARNQRNRAARAIDDAWEKSHERLK